MTIQKLIGTAQVHDEDTRSRADARSMVLASIAARAAYAWELITGSAVSSGMPGTPRNPSGDIGVNFSGPPWGSAWRAPHGGCGGIKPDTGNFLGQRVLGSVSSSQPLDLIVRVYVQPFEDVRLAPLSRLRPIIRAYCDSGGPITITWKCAPDSGPGGFSASIAVTNTSEETIESSSLKWDVRPGLNALRLKATSASSTPVHVCGLSVDNVVKRTH